MKLIYRLVRSTIITGLIALGLSCVNFTYQSSSGERVGLMNSIFLLDFELLKQKDERSLNFDFKFHNPVYEDGAYEYNEKGVKVNVWALAILYLIISYIIISRDEFRLSGKTE